MNSVKYKILALCISLLLVATACSQKEEIRNVATNYLKALVDYRLDDAKKLGDTSAIQFLDGQQKIIDSWSPEERENARKSLENTEVKIINVEIKDNRATVKYEYIKDGKIIQSEQLHLIKKSTGWKVRESM